MNEKSPETLKYLGSSNHQKQDVQDSLGFKQSTGYYDFVVNNEVW